MYAEKYTKHAEPFNAILVLIYDYHTFIEVDVPFSSQCYDTGFDWKL